MRSTYLPILRQHLPALLDDTATPTARATAGALLGPYVTDRVLLARLRDASAEDAAAWEIILTAEREAGALTAMHGDAAGGARTPRTPTPTPGSVLAYLEAAAARFARQPVAGRRGRPAPMSPVARYRRYITELQALRRRPTRAERVARPPAIDPAKFLRRAEHARGKKIGRL